MLEPLHTGNGAGLCSGSCSGGISVLEKKGRSGRESGTAQGFPQPSVAVQQSQAGVPNTTRLQLCYFTYLTSRHVSASLCIEDSHCPEKKANVPRVQTAALLTVNKPQPLACCSSSSPKLRGRPGGRCTRDRPLGVRVCAWLHASTQVLTCCWSPA